MTHLRHPFLRRAAGAAAALALAVTLGGSLPGKAAAETLKLGNEGTYPPFSMVDAKGELTGFEVDLARAMCARMKVECEFTVMDFKALIPSMLQGKFDVLVSQVSPTPERMAKLEFSLPVVYNPQAFVMRKGVVTTFSKEAMTGKGIRLAMQRGGAGIPYINKHFDGVFEHVYYDNPDQMRLDMLAGRLEGVFGAKINWTRELMDTPQGKDYELVGGDHWIGDPAIPPEKRGSSWVMRKGEKELLGRVDTALNALIDDCTFTELRKKYLNVAILVREEACAAKTN